MKRIIFLLVSILLFTQPISAATNEEIEAKIEELEKQKKDIETQIANLKSQIVEWKHYEDSLIEFDYPIKPYFVYVSAFQPYWRSYCFNNPYSEDIDLKFSFLRADKYVLPKKSDGYEEVGTTPKTNFKRYNEEKNIYEDVFVIHVNDSIILEITILETSDMLPIVNDILDSAVYGNEITTDMFSNGKGYEKIYENNYFTEEEIENIEAVIHLAEKYLNMEATKEDVKDRISSYQPDIPEAFTISFAMITDDESTIRESVRKLKEQLENRLPDR